MTQQFSRRNFLAASACLGTGLIAGLTACSSNASNSSDSSSTTQSSTTGQTSESGLPHITVGTLPTEDLLPLWVAESQELFSKEGIDVSIEQFESATQLIAGVSSGAVDLAMTDILVSSSLFASGTSIQMEWVTLGTEASQGRFGIMTNGSSNVSTIQDLAGVPIGVGSNTVLEYVMYKLMQNTGISSDQILVEEIQNIPARWQAMAQGQVAAAMLPASFLALGEHLGYLTIADDTTGENLSQSVMISRSDFANDAANRAAIDSLKDVWDEAASEINNRPDSYRSSLVSHANISEELSDSYPVSNYPLCEMPSNSMVDPVITWMRERNYLSKDISYDQVSGAFSFV